MRRSKTPTFIVELPLMVNAQQAKHLRAHFEAARCLYNALLGEAMRRLKHLRSDALWQQAKNHPKTQKRERATLFSQVREMYGFTEYALHAFSTTARKGWIADHIDSNTAQKLATRAFQAAQRVCFGQARRVRFKSGGRGLDSVEGKTNASGIRFVVQTPQEGNAGWLVWQGEAMPALIDWNDPVLKHGLSQRIKFVRLLRRRASSSRALGADCEGYRYYAHLVVEGLPYTKPKHRVGTSKLGLDVGPSTIAIVPQEGEARLLTFCSELKPNDQTKRRLRRKLDRQLRVNNPQNYDQQKRVRKGRFAWRHSQGYKKTRRRLATRDRKLAAHRKSLHGRLVHEVIACGSTIIAERLSYRAWQKQYGKSVGAHAPGMFLEHLRRTVVRTGGILHEVPTTTTKLSQYCHGCGRYEKKPLSQRWHHCACGIGPVQRDLYSAFLSCHLDLKTLVPSIAQDDWESAETRLRAAIEDVRERARAGEALPQSFGIPGAGARLPRSRVSDHQELRYRHDRVEAVVRWHELSAF